MWRCFSIYKFSIYNFETKALKFSSKYLIGCLKHRNTCNLCGLYLMNVIGNIFPSSIKDLFTSDIRLNSHDTS